MGRLKDEFLARIEMLSHRVVDVAEALPPKVQYRRVVDQLIGCGTSIGANTFEADEAMSRADFCRSLQIVLKEVNEARFWVRFVEARHWIPSTRLEPLRIELDEVRRVVGTMVSRTRKGAVPAES